VYQVRLTAKALWAIGEWPSKADPVQALIEALNRAIESTSNEEEKSKLETMKGAVGGITKDTITNVLSAAIVAMSGIL
jgi:hypothetical protein